MYDLPLEPVFGSFRSIDCESNREIKGRIEAIQSFEGKLKFYNNHVRSLSAYGMDAQIYLELDRPNNCLKIYCGCATCRKQTDFDPKKEQTFLELRAKEIERLRKAVDKHKGYHEKLNAVFETKGFHPFNTPPVIHPNVPYDGTTNIDLDLHHTKPVIDLWPDTKEERIIYNDFVRAAFDSKYRTAIGFSQAYKDFDFEKEKQRFEKAADEAKVQDGRLREYLISEIERHFDYPACIEAQDKETDIQKSIRENLAECGIVPHLFPKLVCGVPVDLDESVLNEIALMRYVHFSELVKFYAYLKQGANGMKGKASIDMLSLNSILAKNDLTFYTNKENIPNQGLVKQTIDYFMEGEGRRAFKALTFLNLLWPQYEFLIKNVADSEKVISHLLSLPLSELEKHVLFGLLLKWFGGYPINNLNPEYQRILKHIEKLFLAHPGQTPEKEFCKRDDATRKKFAKLGIAYTTAFNHNLDAKQVYDALEEDEPQEKTYSSFNELFEDAARNGSVGEFESQQTFLMKRSRYNYLFNEWLLERKGWEFNNDETYTGFLTKENWLEFLKHERQQEAKRQTRIEREKQSWQIKPVKESTEVMPRFERELEKANVPFVHVVTGNGPFKNELFKQFVSAETKPCFDLYLADFYTEEEINKGFADVHNKIPVTTLRGVAANFVATTPFESSIIDLHNEFANKAAKKELPLQYFCPDIESTVIVQALRAIGNEYDILKKSVFDAATDKYKEAELRASNVLAFSKKLEKFAIFILECIMDENENILLYIHKEDVGKKGFWDTLKSNFNNALTKHQTKQGKSEEADKKEPVIKPILKTESLDIVFDILKDFFSQEQKPVLKELLQTGNKASEHLIFLDNGNRLADAFKQLKKADVILGCEQKELEKWISENFKFRFRQEIKDFTPRYLNDIISTNKDLCKKPLLNVLIEKATGKVLITKV